MSAIDPKVKNILDERLAKGEIDSIQYQRLIKEITQGIEGSATASEESTTKPAINLGSLQHAWRGVDWECRLHSKYNNDVDVKSHLEWMNNNTDYVLTDEYLIVLSGFSATKLGEMARTTALLGTTGGLAGAAFVSLPALLVGGASEKLFGKKNKLSPETLAAIYESGYAVYSKISDLVFKSFKVESGYLLVKNHSIVSAIGKFKSSLSGDIDLCLLLNESFGSVVKYLKAAGCNVTEQPNTLKEETQINEYLPSEYVDLKNPRHISHDDLAICVKCSHYMPKKGWLGRRGDQKMDTVPSNDKLPCQIPVEASSAWDHYFSIPVDNREYLYPINCPKFVRK